MHIPEFVAEASVYRSVYDYSQLSYLDGSHAGGMAIPQQESLLPVRCYPPVCLSGGEQRCCYWTPSGPRCWTRQCPPIDPCAHCRTPAQCCVCNGGTWTGRVCI